jgi:uncharacterized protein YoaH (UPF0181 family)
MSMKQGVPMHLDSIIRERLQNSDTQSAIELFFELLRSGHSAGEILNRVNSIQRKSKQGDKSITEYLQAKVDEAPADIAAEGAPVEGARESTRRIPGVSASHGADDGSTEAPPATESVPLNRRESDDRKQLGDGLPGSVRDILGPVAAPTSTSRDATLGRNDLDQIRLGGFSRTARRIASRVLYTALAASAAVIGFSIVNGDRYTQPMIARVLSGISSGIETAATLRAAIDHAEAVEKTSNSTMQVADTDASRAPVPFRPAKPDPATPSPAQRVAAEVRAMISAALSQANAPYELEAGRQQDVTPVSASTAAASATATLREAPAATAMKADAAGSTELAAAATLAPATWQALKPDPEAHEIASTAAAKTEHRTDGDPGDTQAANLTKIARPEQLDAASPPARETAAAAATRRVGEITPEEPRFKTALADALVTRGDAFFAAGDLASARLFYEYAAKGNGAAALRLGSTYDPGFLAHAHIGRVQGDAAIALYWYRRAHDLGNRDAEVLLKRMENTAR